MPCTSPLQAYQHYVTKAVTFKESGDTHPLTLPCGKCISCRLDKSRQWATRCVHEAQMHEENSFITLTYSDEAQPEDGALVPQDLTKFLKRLRHHMGAFRYYACGEYGDTTKRAHYHACIFGIDFHEDRIPFGTSNNGATTYTSKALELIWGKGHCVIGDLTFETAAYTARYVMKKQYGKTAGECFKLNEYTGELTPVQEPFARMSLNPAIGKTWVERYHKDIYNLRKDYISINGHKVKPPKYYDKVYETINPTRMEDIKEQRKIQSEPLTETEMRARDSNVRAAIIRKRKL